MDLHQEFAIYVQIQKELHALLLQQHAQQDTLQLMDFVFHALLPIH